MATDSPFDVRVVNTLERPTINDFNQAQAAARTTSQLLAGIALDMPYGGNPDIWSVGFYGAGFKVVADDPVSMELRISPGTGFIWRRYPSAVLNAGGITGVNVNSTAQAFPFVMDGPLGKTVRVPTAPGSGKVRRDAIAIRHIDSGNLRDFVVSDVFNPVAQSFYPESQYKTYSWVLNEVTVEYIDAGLPTATSDLIYVKGLEVPDAGPVTYANTPPPTIPSGYTLLAVINVDSGAITISNNRICDYRRLFFSGRSLSFPIQLLAGAKIDGVSPLLPGTELQFEPPYLPGNMEVAIILTQPTVANVYTLFVKGFYNANQIVASLSPGGNVQFEAEDACLVTILESATPNEGAPPSPVVLSPAYRDALADPAQAMPAVEWAVGQPYSAITFALGMIDVSAPPGVYYNRTSFTKTGATTRTISGIVTMSY